MNNFDKKKLKCMFCYEHKPLIRVDYKPIKELYFLICGSCLKTNFNLGEDNDE